LGVFGVRVEDSRKQLRLVDAEGYKHEAFSLSVE
jgi:hypothetical protein